MIAKVILAAAIFALVVPLFLGVLGYLVAWTMREGEEYWDDEDDGL